MMWWTMLSDERREVAARMRDSVLAGEYLDEAIVRAIYAVKGETKRPVGSVLADLIDPTCHIVLRQSDSDFTDEPHYLCSRCGKEAVYVYERSDYTLAGIVSHARYCSYCGARVVSE